MTGVFLMSCDRQVARTQTLGLVACANLVGNLALIPALGIKGAAIAALISEALMVILFAARLRDVVGWPKVSSRLAISIAGIASFYLPSTLMPSLSLGVVVPTSVFLYLATLLALKNICDHSKRNNSRSRRTPRDDELARPTAFRR